MQRPGRSGGGLVRPGAPMPSWAHAGTAPVSCPTSVWAPHPATKQPWDPREQIAAAPVSRRRRNLGRLAGAAVVALVVTGGVASTVNRNRPITVPTRLRGVAQVTNPESRAMLQPIVDGLDAENSARSTAAFYSDADGRPRYVLALVRGRLDVDEEFALIRKTSGSRLGELSTIDGMRCGEGGGVALCMWSGSGGAGMVMSFVGGLADAAAAGVEAKATLD